MAMRCGLEIVYNRVSKGPCATWTQPYNRVAKLRWSGGGLNQAEKSHEGRTILCRMVCHAGTYVLFLTFVIVRIYITETIRNVELRDNPSLQGFRIAD
jgi:hypothetical protein